MDHHETDRPSAVIARAYLDVAEVLAGPGGAGSAPPSSALHAELLDVMRMLRPTMARLATSLEALSTGAPTEPATTVAIEAIVDVNLAWLRLVHHAEALLASGPDPAARRVALLAQALAPATRITADRACQALVLESTT
ncbi:hypothetical protein HC251_00530 [Iamia sp. SCSIO 61187]|uniref:hypothetical protein n=1 Tax=Iamia sp. SCSIO 61187 TaxID=2722752 RepID=UPI001C62E0B1|nr:hypothetical protein [Iamia sp. SCSIO 61187]QYG91067.1 hypothetical protein HC251_00530 [Iamia sp. SCSIO 61187]